MQSIVRQSPASKDVNTDAEEARAMKAFYKGTTGGDSAHREDSMCCSELQKVCELAIAL
jgi:hypothetical protein